ncbi:MAG: DUF222 domain-containing protein [Acidimicrobiales bacterium]
MSAAEALEPDAGRFDGATPAHRALRAWGLSDGQMLEAVVARLDAAVDELVGLDVRTADNGELGAGLVVVQRIKAKLCAAETSMLDVFDSRRAYRADGSRSTATWLAARSRTPRKIIAGLVSLGRRLRRAPRTREALGRGEIDQTRAEVLGGLAAAPRKPVAEAFPAAEKDLLGVACSKSFDEFCRAASYWKDTVDPDGSDAHADKAHDSRRLHVSQSFEGRWFLDGVLGPVGGQEVAEALRRICDDMLAADRRAARAIHGPDCPDDLLERTPAQRRADALVELARRAVAAPHDARKPRPLVSILVGYESFRGPIRETFNGTVLAAGDVARNLTEADIERVVFSNQGRDITDLGRRRRLFTAAQRRAIEVRDRTCWHPDCDEPAERCDMDHGPKPWDDGGETNLSNGRPGCILHNRVHPTGPAPPDDPDP